MSMPAVPELLLPVLKLTADGAEHPTTEMWQQISIRFNLTPDELAATLKNGIPVIRNRIAWAIVHLELADILVLISKGIYQISARGVSLLGTNPQGLTVKALHEMYGVPESKKRDNSRSRLVDFLRQAPIVSIKPI